MAISIQQSAVYTETPTRVPTDAGNKYWADDLTWKELPTASKFPLTCDTVDVGETLTIPNTFQFIIEGTLHNNGTIDNNGKVVIL